MTSVALHALGLKNAVGALFAARSDDLTLQHPAALLLLLPLAVVIAVFYRRDQLPRLLFAKAKSLRTLPRGRAVWWYACARLSLVLAAILTTVALSTPQVLSTPDAATTEGIDLVVALDVSGSMKAADFRPNDRLYVAKTVIDAHVFNRKNDRIGLVVFAGEAFTQAPLTHDRALLRTILQGVRTGVIVDGTAIGDGLGLSLARMKESTAKTKAVIVLTDGDNNAGSLAPESAADLARDMGVKVFPILVGKEGLVPFPQGTDVFGQTRYVNVEMPTNPTLLKKMAEMTGGSFFSATDPEALVSSFARILDSLDRSLLEGAPLTRKRIPLAPLLLLPALLLLALGLTLSFTRASVVP